MKTYTIEARGDARVIHSSPRRTIYAASPCEGLSQTPQERAEAYIRAAEAHDRLMLRRELGK